MIEKKLQLRLMHSEPSNIFEGSIYNKDQLKQAFNKLIANKPKDLSFNHLDECQAYDQYVLRLSNSLDYPLVDLNKLDLNQINQTQNDLIKQIKELEDKFHSIDKKLINKLSKSINDKKKSEIALEIEAIKQGLIESEALEQLNLFLTNLQAKQPLEKLMMIELLGLFDDLIAYHSSFKFTIEQDKIYCDFMVNSKDVIPQTSCMKKNEKITYKPLPKKTYYQLMYDYVLSSSQRIARDLFNCLDINQVIICVLDHNDQGIDNTIDVATIFSIIIDQKPQTSSYDDQQLLQFNHQMQFNKTKGFRAVPRLS